MRGCRRSCLLQLLILGAVIAAVHAVLRAVTGQSDGVAWGVAAVSGLLVLLAILLAHSTWVTLGEIRMLRRSHAGERPRDGAYVAVSGRIRSSSPLRGPLSGETVVAYEYAVLRLQQTGRNRSMMPLFDGKGLAPSVVDSQSGPIRLLAVPRFELEAATLSSQEALRRAKAWVQSVRFASRETSTERTAALWEEWSDDDGSYQIDRNHTERDPHVPDDCRFDEYHVRPGDEVCVFGLYSEARGGIVPDERWGRPVRVSVGSAADSAASLRGRAFRYAFGVAFFVAAAVAVAVAFVRATG